MLHRPEVLFDRRVGNAVALLLVSARHLHRDLAADGADLTLQIAKPGFLGIAGDDARDSGVGPDQRRLFDAVLLHLLRDEMLLGDGQLLLIGVAGQTNDFHAVEERRLNRVEHVRGDDEHHVRQVVGNAEVVIAEREILFGIEDLEECR